ncbi:hypothetical protein WJX75_000101 [Coccomyxa subellipsoidea]|uniref:Uncharacterized protein n=1 Tax=Coccomyxa subellipsoidea TaxID=248742 RepID=A0ABR2YZE7_9CHLO
MRCIPVVATQCGGQSAAAANSPVEYYIQSNLRQLYSIYLNVCQIFIQRAVSWARAGNISVVTPGQIEQDEIATNPHPSARCCATERDFLLNGCRCDGNVQMVSRKVGIPSGGLKAESLYAVAACNISITLDTAPYPCPGEPATPAGR